MLLPREVLPTELVTFYTHNKMTEPSLTSEEVASLLYDTVVDHLSLLHLPYFQLSSRNRFTVSITVSGLGRLSLFLHNDMSDPTIALSIYDSILSFPKELRCIWGRKYGTGTTLYFSIKYSTILNMLFQLLSCLIVSEYVVVSCG